MTILKMEDPALKQLIDELEKFFGLKVRIGTYRNLQLMSPTGIVINEITVFLDKDDGRWKYGGHSGLCPGNIQTLLSICNEEV